MRTVAIPLERRAAKRYSGSRQRDDSDAAAVASLPRRGARIIAWSRS
jgi:hypothetical protein